MWYVFAVPAKTGRAPVEDRRILRSGGILWPIPVLSGDMSAGIRFLQVGVAHRLVPCVSTLLPERLLVRIRKPSMPRHEVARKMDGQSLLDVCDNEVVELRSGESETAELNNKLVQVRTRDLAPAETFAGVLAGSSCRHLTAFT